MTPVKQEFRHNPPETYGDCHRAAMASLLDLPLYAVPHFMHGLGPKDGEIFHRRESEFLMSRGLCAIQFGLFTNATVSEACTIASTWNPDRYFLLGGMTRRMIAHTVIADSTGIVWDPHPDDCGIEWPLDEGCYWITYIARELRTA